MNQEIRLKRVYDPPEESDGFRVLAERLWPRGLSKERARVDLWLKEAGPTPELRKWYGKDPEKWDQFRARYLAELEIHPENLAPLVQALAEHGKVTLVYAASDPERNTTALLKAFLEELG